MMRTLGWIVLCLCVLAGFGLYFEWFTVSASKGSTDKENTDKGSTDKENTDKGNTDSPNIHVTIDKEKFKEDIAAVKEKVTGKSIDGQIRRIETTRQELTILGKQAQEVTIKVDASTKIKIGDKDASFGDLKIDDPVSVKYDATKDGNIARTVTVSNKAVTDTRP